MDKNFFGGMALGLIVGVVLITYSKDAEHIATKCKKAVASKVKQGKKSVEELMSQD